MAGADPNAAQIARMQRQRRATYGLVNPDAFATVVSFAAVRAALAAATTAVAFNGQKITSLADGSASGDAATTGQTYFVPYVAPANPATNIPPIKGQNIQQGGTVAAPLAAEVLRIWPRDPTTAGPFGLFLSGGLFNATRDTIFAIGYNYFNELGGSEPSAVFAIENNYEVSPGVHLMEMYGEFVKSDHTVTHRPFYANYNRVNRAVQTVVQYNDVAGEGFSVTDGLQVVEALWDASGMTLGRASKASTVLGVSLTATIGGPVSILSAAGAAQIGGLANGYFDANAIHMRSNGATSQSAIFGDGAGGELVKLFGAGAVTRFDTTHAKPTLSGALSAVTDPAAKAVLTSIVDALAAAAGVDIAINGTT